MKKTLIFVFLVLIMCLALVPFAYGQDEIYHSTYLKLNAEVDSTLEITRQAGDSIDYVKAELYFFPKTDVRQEVLEIILASGFNPDRQRLRGKPCKVSDKFFRQLCILVVFTFQHPHNCPVSR